MADDLGIKRCWFHPGKRPHYDIPKRRMAEILEKCRVVKASEIVAICDTPVVELIKEIKRQGFSDFTHVSGISAKGRLTFVRRTAKKTKRVEIRGNKVLIVERDSAFKTDRTKWTTVSEALPFVKFDEFLFGD